MSEFLKRSNELTVVASSLRAYTTYIKLIKDEFDDLPLAALEDRRIRFMTFVGQQLFDSHLPMRLCRRSRRSPVTALGMSRRSLTRTTFGRDVKLAEIAVMKLENGNKTVNDL